MTPLARFRDFGLRYRGQDTAALSGLNLDLAAGEKLAIIGESGSGKSTIALALAGLLSSGARATGSLTWPGFNQPPLPGRDLGFVFQDPGGSFNPVVSIGKQIAEIIHVHKKLSAQEARRQAVVLLDRVRLADPERIAQSYPHQLSGGQHQRAAIAAAIAGGPSVLIADEATSALDTIVQAEIVQLIRTLVDEEGMTLVFITHDIALAHGLADRVAVLRSGRLVEIGDAAELMRKPQDSYTRQLIAAQRAVEA